MNQKQLELQCELYKLLLNAQTATGKEMDFYLSEALRLVIGITGAQMGYIELKDSNNEAWLSTFDCSEDDIKSIKRNISSGIIADTIASGKTIVSPSAFLDDRFQQYHSVQTGNIQAVLCSPIINERMKGVIYLQGDEFFGKDLRSKKTETELFSNNITPLLSRLNCQKETNSKELRSQYNLTGVIGESDKIISALKEVLLIADLDVTVLLKGETGTGKNLMAKTIHNNSNRKYRPFFHLNCANLPEQLLESELFGAAKGSHSAAFSEVTGKISAAEGGTLFLDEIGELSISMQAKLLQFLENGFYYPLGSKNPENPDVRIIAASNVDFDEAVKNKKFRADLYYRICVFPIELPPLRDCKRDIGTMVEAFTQQYCKEYQIGSLGIPDTTLVALEEHPWPGNVRELQHRTQQAVLRAKQDASSNLETTHFFTLLELDQPSPDLSTNGQSETYRDGKISWEKSFIAESLQKNQWNISQTAKLLEMSRSQLNKLIKDHHIKRLNED